MYQCNKDGGWLLPDVQLRDISSPIWYCISTPVITGSSWGKAETKFNMSWMMFWIIRWSWLVIIRINLSLAFVHLGQYLSITVLVCFYFINDKIKHSEQNRCRCLVLILHINEYIDQKYQSFVFLSLNRRKIKCENLLI